MVVFLACFALAAPTSRAIVWGGGPTPEAGETWMTRWQQEAPDYADLIALPEGWPKLVQSDSVPGMKPGFHVVVLGICPAGDERAPLELLKALHPSVYAREVTDPAPPGACPALREGVSLLGRVAVERAGSSAAVVSVGVSIPEVDGGQSAQGAIRSTVLAIGRDATGARTAFTELGNDQARPPGGFGSSAEVRVSDVQRGRITVESVRQWTTVECGVWTTATHHGVGLLDGAFDHTATTETTNGVCIQ